MPACTGTCHVTKCRACYFSREVHTCPRSCRYGCGENPGRRCFKEWSKCVKNGLGKMVSPRHGPYVYMLCPPRLAHSLFGSWWLKSYTCIVCACSLTKLTYQHLLLLFPQTGRKSASLFIGGDPCTC